MSGNKRDCILLLSGGIDSTVLAILNQHRIRECLMFRYHQPAERKELEASRMVCERLGLNLHFKDLELDLMDMGTGTGAHIVPIRNAIFLAIAANRAVALGCDTVMFGAHAADADQYEDCRASYVESMQHVVEPFGVRIEAPLLELGLSKLEMVSILRLHKMLAMTRSCYGAGEPCEECSSCRERNAAIEIM